MRRGLIPAPARTPEVLKRGLDGGIPITEGIVTGWPRRLSWRLGDASPARNRWPERIGSATKLRNGDNGQDGGEFGVAGRHLADRAVEKIRRTAPQKASARR
jgi:hypothetical protein